MDNRSLGRSGLTTAPIVLGCNVFGWTADAATSHELLDRFLDQGFNAIDTANYYSRFIPGHAGGESEIVIGDWFRARGRRDAALLITKVGADMGEGGKGLSAANIIQSCEASLKRLRTDYIDLYFSHLPDPDVPVDETLEAYQKLIDAGKIRAAGGSNYTADGLREALKSAAGAKRARYEVLQPHFNLYTRNAYEGALEDVCLEDGIGVITYYSLASGFLTGKYRDKADLTKSIRGTRTKDFMDARGFAMLALLDDLAAQHQASPAQIALAWLIARPSVTAPIVSATSRAQLDEILGAVHIHLGADDIARLNAA